MNSRRITCFCLPNAETKGENGVLTMPEPNHWLISSQATSCPSPIVTPLLFGNVHSEKTVRPYSSCLITHNKGQAACPSHVTFSNCNTVFNPSGIWGYQNINKSDQLIREADRALHSTQKEVISRVLPQKSQLSLHLMSYHPSQGKCTHSCAKKSHQCIKQGKRQ